MTQYYKLCGRLGQTREGPVVSRAVICTPEGDDDRALELARSWGQQVHHTNGVDLVEVYAMPPMFSPQAKEPEKLRWTLVVGPGTEGYREPPLYYEQTLR